MTPPIVFVLLGLALGTHGLGWLDLEAGEGVIHRLAEITLALVLFTDACRIDLSCLRRERSIPQWDAGCRFDFSNPAYR